MDPVPRRNFLSRRTTTITKRGGRLARYRMATKICLPNSAQEHLWNGCHVKLFSTYDLKYVIEYIQQRVVFLLGMREILEANIKRCRLTSLTDISNPGRKILRPIGMVIFHI